jgi:phenylpropionate dioxygenase-like ring-hydroxylating dioxygenase large terminal subunit
MELKAGTRDYRPDPANPVSIHPRAYTDPEIFALEMDRIFRRGWVYVGHAGEVPNVGDFCLKRIGTVPVIMVRGADREVRLLLNRCRHRGATVCQIERGNARAFRCAYHGWTYRLDGALSGVPYPTGYGSDFRKDDFGLTRVPRVGSYRGFIFGSLAAEGITLEEHLGAARNEIDLFTALSDDDEIGVVAGTQKYEFHGNWKLQVENALDGYHPNFVHSTFVDAVVRRQKENAEKYGIKYNPEAFGANGGVTRDLGGGHVMMDYGFRIYDTLSADVPPPVRTMTDAGARHLAELERRLGRERALDALRAGATHALVFPNLILIGVQIRTVLPVGLNHTQVTLQPTTLRWLPDDVNAIRIRGHEAFYGSASFAAPDDVEVFERVSDGAGVALQQWQPITRGLNRERRDENGMIIAETSDELTLRAIWRHWAEIMGETGRRLIQTGKRPSRSRKRRIVRAEQESVP